MGSAGQQDPILQKWRPRPMTLVSATTNGEHTPQVVFRVPVPDSRLRVKISVLFAFVAGQQTSSPDLSPGGATLWLSAADDDDSGSTGTTLTETNLEGTQAAPTAIPFTPGLVGYSREFITSADYIEGVFKTAHNGFNGYWVLQLRYQPDTGQRFSTEEWEAIVGYCKPTVPYPPPST
jgi:hypothetical protein